MLRRGDTRWVAALVLLSLLAHLWRLGLRPLAHDEAIDAWFSWQAGGGEVVPYDPVYHGPLRFYLEGTVLHLFGSGAGWARLTAALCGVAVTGVVASSRRLLGRVGAPVAGVLTVVSPTFLTVTRTGREDSLVALLSLGLLLTVAYAARAPRPAHIVGGACLLAASWATKETTFLFGFVAAWWFLAVALLAWRRPEGQARAALGRVAALSGQPWKWAAAAFLGLLMVVFTSLFREPDGLRAGLVDGLRYWWGQHEVGRGGQPWFFYLVLDAAYEWLLVPLAALGVVVSVRRRSLVGGWFTTMWLGQLVVYSWAGEKFARLAQHPLVPAVLLAGMGADAVWARLRRSVVGAPAARTRAGALAAIALALVAANAFVATRPAIWRGHDPRELLVTVQTSPDVPRAAAAIRAAAAAGCVDRVLVDARGGGSWPWVWYLHGVEGVEFRDLESGEVPVEFDVVIIDGTDTPPTAHEGFEVSTVVLRQWWVPDYGTAGTGDLARWFFTREPWSPTAGYPQYVVAPSGVMAGTTAGVTAGRC